MAIFCLGACDRPDILEARPTFSFIAPDTQAVSTENQVLVKFKLSHFRPLQSVKFQDQVLNCPNPFLGCELRVNLRSGLNRLAFAAIDTTGLVGRDTLDILHLNLRVTTAPNLPAARGGMAATRLNPNEWLLTGGCAQYSQSAQNQAYLYNSNQGTFTTLNNTLKVARTGHIQILLPDGRVLIVGGSRKENPEIIADLVETVEVYEATTQTFKTVVVASSDPIRQTYHSGFLHPYQNNQYLYLFGGKGDIQYGANPQMGTKADLRAFKWQNDTLKVASPTFAALINPMMGQTQVLVEQNSEKSVYWLNGGNFALNQVANRAFNFVIKGTVFDDAVATHSLEARFRAVAVFNSPTYVFLQGGSTNGFLSGISNTAEVYLPQTHKMLHLQNVGAKKMAHVATLIDGTRILSCGGYTETGAAKNNCEWINFN